MEYELDRDVTGKLAGQNVHVERSGDRTTITIMHDAPLESTGRDGSGISMSLAKTGGRRATIGYTPDGRGVWLALQLAVYKEPRRERHQERAGIAPDDVQRMIAEAVQDAIRERASAEPDTSAPIPLADLMPAQPTAAPAATKPAAPKPSATKPAVPKPAAPKPSARRHRRLMID